MRYKILSLIIIFITAIECALQAQSIAVYFESIPEHILIQIDSNRKKDMIDMFKAGISSKTKTKFGGDAEILQLDEKYLKMLISENMTVEMALLGDSTNYIAVIKTLCSPACDSEIDFFTTTWNPINDITVTKPDPEDFIYNTDGTGKGPLKPTWDGGKNIENKQISIDKKTNDKVSAMLSDDNADKKEMQKSGNSANSLNVNNDRRKPSEIIDILPVKYEFVFENKEPIQQIKAIHSLKEILTEQDFNLIKSKIAPEIYLKIDKHN